MRTTSPESSTGPGRTAKRKGLTIIQWLEVGAIGSNPFSPKITPSSTPRQRRWVADPGTRRAYLPWRRLLARCLHPPTSACTHPSSLITRHVLVLLAPTLHACCDPSASAFQRAE